MSEVKHTPGPWVAASHPSSIVGWPIVAQTGRLICNLATPPKDINRVGKALAEYEAFIAECGANARLIAAAPELAEVVKAFIAETVDYATLNNLGDPEKQHNVKWARAVLAKAEFPHA